MKDAADYKTTIYEHKSTFWAVQIDPETKLGRTTKGRYKNRSYVREMLRGRKPAQWTGWKKLPLPPPPRSKVGGAHHAVPVVQYTGPIDLGPDE